MYFMSCLEHHTEDDVWYHVIKCRTCGDCYYFDNHVRNISRIGHSDRCSCGNDLEKEAQKYL
jgi:hypothetical protein